MVSEKVPVSTHGGDTFRRSLGNTSMIFFFTSRLRLLRFFLTNSKGQASACGVLRNSDDEGLPGSSGSCMQSCGHVYKVKTGEADAHEAISSHTSLDKLAKLAIGPDYTPPVEVTAHISNDAMGTKFE
ncbi:hypothetical protein V6N13_128736 [Hibiscus sabdariffa]